MLAQYFLLCPADRRALCFRVVLPSSVHHSVRLSAMLWFAVIIFVSFTDILPMLSMFVFRQTPFGFQVKGQGNSDRFL